MTLLETIIEEFNSSALENIDNNEPINISEAMSIGDMLPQGDVGLIVIEKVPPSAVPMKIDIDNDFQIAPGNTKGSRHTIKREYLKHLNFYNYDDGDVLSNMIIEAKCKFDLNHPEHADHIGYPEGVYRVRHQQNEKRARVLD